MKCNHVFVSSFKTLKPFCKEIVTKKIDAYYSYMQIHLYIVYMVVTINGNIMIYHACMVKLLYEKLINSTILHAHSIS